MENLHSYSLLATCTNCFLLLDFLVVPLVLFKVGLCFKRSGLHCVELKVLHKIGQFNAIISNKRFRLSQMWVQESFSFESYIYWLLLMIIGWEGFKLIIQRQSLQQVRLKFANTHSLLEEELDAWYL